MEAESIRVLFVIETCPVRNYSKANGRAGRDSSLNFLMALLNNNRDPGGHDGTMEQTFGFRAELFSNPVENLDPKTTCSKTFSPLSYLKLFLSSVRNSFGERRRTFADILPRYHHQYS